jgi:hypothetical protein
MITGVDGECRMGMSLSFKLGQQLRSMNGKIYYIDNNGVSYDNK